MGPDLAPDYECHLEPLRPNKFSKTNTAETHSSGGGGWWLWVKVSVLSLSFDVVLLSLVVMVHSVATPAL